MAKAIEEIEKMQEENVQSVEVDLFQLMYEHRNELNSVLELLKTAEESGILTLLRSLLENRDASSSEISNELTRPKNIRFVRNLMSIYTLLSNIDPDIVRNFMLNLASAVDHSDELKKQGPMGLMAIRSNMKDPDVTVGFRVLFEIARGFTTEKKRKE